MVPGVAFVAAHGLFSKGDEGSNVKLHATLVSQVIERCDVVGLLLNPDS